METLSSPSKAAQPHRIARQTSRFPAISSSPIPHPSQRRQRNEWIGKVIRQWSKQKKSALLEGTAKLVANGGYRFLQELWERGVPITNEDAIDALEVFLNAKQG